MADFLRHLTTAFQFFTRLPLPAGGKTDAHAGHDGALADASLAFPVIGFFIGLLVSLVWLAANLFFSPLISAGLAIASGLLLTGALHEDGLADCADGFGGGHEKARILEIMRDSTIGTYGGCALILSIGLRWVALSHFGNIDGAIALILAHGVSRAAITIALAFTSYARKEGLGKTVSTGIGPGVMAATLAIPLVASLVAANLAGLIAGLIALALAWLFLKYLDHRLGGYTGDGLGGMQQLAEIGFLLVLSGFWT